MGMSETEFEFISPRAFYNKVHGYNYARQSEYELVRLQTVELLNIQIDKKGKIKRPESLWKFPWDTKEKASQEDGKKFAEKVNKLIDGDQ